MTALLSLRQRLPDRQSELLLEAMTALLSLRQRLPDRLLVAGP
jgi:hypothetical protein